MCCVWILHVSDNTGASLVLNRSSAFTSVIIWISRGIVMILTGNSFWKLLDQAYPYVLLKMHAFICHFVFLWSRIFILRFGVHSESGLCIPNYFNYFISHTSNQPFAHFPVLVPYNSVYFPLAPTLVRFIWAMLSSRNFKFLYRLSWGLFPLSERKIIFILDAFTEAISTVSKHGSLDHWIDYKLGIFPPPTRISSRYWGRC